MTGTATPTQIPFSVDVEQHLGPEVKFEYPVSDSATFTVRQIRNAVPSPDGSKLAFTALDRLYVVDVPASGNAMTPRKLVDGRRLSVPADVVARRADDRVHNVDRSRRWPHLEDLGERRRAQRS